jgi:hypothetical protein
MSSKHNFHGAIGAWIDSELHPAGATSPSSPNSNFNSMKLNDVYKSLDYLNIAWYGTDMSNPNQPTISTSNPGLAMIVKDAKSQNPNIKIFATLAWTTQIYDDLVTIIGDSNKLSAFASNISSYLTNNNMDGFDIDWEYPISNLSSSQCAAWLNAMGSAFGSNQYISISPATAGGLDGNAVNKNCSIVNLQSYSGFTYPNAFVGIGIDPALLGFGAKFETQGSAPFQNAFQAYKQYKAGFTVGSNHYDYNTICNWRLDSDDWAFEQGQQKLLKQYIDGGPFSVPFNDETIINAQSTATLMKSVMIRSGEVVDSIQTSNENHGGSYVVEMLQHGGDSGTQQDTINLAAGLNSFSYVTGNWYGNSVIAQITINGISYPRSVSSSVSNTRTHNIQAPAGQTIVAFEGETQYVLLAGGGFTWVLSEIDAVFG